MMYLFSKLMLCAAVLVTYSILSTYYHHEHQAEKTEAAMSQLDDGKAGVDAQREVQRENFVNNYAQPLGWVVVVLFCVWILYGDVKNLFKKASVTGFGVWLLAFPAMFSSGCSCVKPFEPVKLEVISSHEEAFLLPLQGDAKKQKASNNEDFLKESLVYTKQVQIPQQWVEKGRAIIGYNGEWRDAAILVRVDTSPITREWTADPNTGTGKKNEAVWVMTSDQVEFSTGWTITARVSSRDDAVKFLHNYPNGSLTTVLDNEVRGKLQAEFGLAVTDLPMDELRKNATPHIERVVKSITMFFKGRGIQITNLGITGGFVYKDKSIIDTLVRVFNAEQEKTMAMANTNAQIEKNKAVILKAQGEADAILKTKKAEADGIKLVADARLYEIEKATKERSLYIQLKQLELQKELLLKWDGSYPKYFIGSSGSSPNMLLQLPALEPGPKEARADKNK